MKRLIFFILIVWSGCSSSSFVEITEKYLEISHNPYASVLYEVKVLQFDSLANYPIDEILISTYSIVFRKTHKPVNKRSHIKMYFSKYNEKYIWKLWQNPPLMEFTYKDTFNLKKNTWYKIRDEVEESELYFFWKGGRNNFILLKKPFPPPGPW